MKIYIDGEFFEKHEAKILVFDHGLLYGDGVPGEFTADIRQSNISGCLLAAVYGISL